MTSRDDKTSRDHRNRFLNGITVVVTVLAIILGGDRLLEMLSREPDLGSPVTVSDWSRFASEGHRLGPADATVTVVVFFDFMCPYCQDAALALQALRLRYPEDLAVVYRYAPTTNEASLRFAKAAECAAQRGQFISFHDVVMAWPDSMQNTSTESWATHAGVADTVSFLACLDDAMAITFQRDTLAARELGIRGTPMFLVGDLLVEGYPGFDELHQIVREAVQRKATGATASRLEHQLPWAFTRVWHANAVTHVFMGDTYINTWAVDTDVSGNVYLLDRRAAKVFVLSQNGELIDSIGRSGDGPGEFCNPRALDVTADGLLTVVDLCRPGFLRWRVPSGRLLEQIRTVEAISFDGRVRVFSEDTIIATELESVYDPESDAFVYHVSQWTTTGVERLFSGGMARRNTFAPCGNPMVYPMFFEPQLAWDMRDRTLAVAEDSAYAIHVFVDGKASGYIEMGIAPRQVTQTMIERQMEANPRWERLLNRCGASSTEAIESIGFSRYLQAIEDVRVGPGGEIWVRRGHVADEAGLIDVFDAGGRHLGTLPGDSPFPAAFLLSDRIIVTGEDQLGPTLTAFHVSRG